MKLIKYIIAVLLVLCWAGSGFAVDTSYYVATGGDGSDPTNGTKIVAGDYSDAYGSLATCIAGAALGNDDFVYVCDPDGGGETYTGQHNFYSVDSGSSGHPVTVLPYSDHDITLAGTGGVYAVKIQNTDYITIQGFTLHDGSTYVMMVNGSEGTIIDQNTFTSDDAGECLYFINTAKANSGLVVSNNSFAADRSGAGQGINLNVSSANAFGILIDSNNFTDAGVQAVYFSETSSGILTAVLNDNIVSGADTNGVVFDTIDNSGSSIDINGLDITGVGKDSEGLGLYINDCDGLVLTIDDLNIYDCPAKGLEIRDSELSTSSELTDSILFSNDAHNFFMDRSSNLTIDGLKSSYAGAGTSTQADNVRITGMADGAANTNVSIINSYVGYANCDNISLDEDSTPNDVDTVSIKKTLIEYSGQLDESSCGDGFTPHDGATNAELEDVVFHRNRNSGIAATATGDGYTVTRCSFIYNGDAGSVNLGCRGGIQINSANGAAADSWTIRNCLFVGNYPFEIATHADDDDVFDSDYNHFYHIGNECTEANFMTVAFTGCATGVATTYANYIGAGNAEVNSTYGDPRLNTGDFTFRKGSPCLEEIESAAFIKYGAIVQGISSSGGGGWSGSRWSN